MKTMFALVALAFSTVASSACYLIYTPNNELVWRSDTPPVAMDKLSLDAEIHKIVPKGHLVIVDTGDTNCTKLDLTTRTTMRQRAEQIKLD